MTGTEEGTAEPRIAAFPIAAGVPVDTLLAGLVAALQAEGWRLAGFRQTGLADGGMAVVALSDGAVFGISQALGPGATGCRLDPRGLAAAAGAALVALDAGADLVVLPRFGKAEAEGGGFRTVIERACACGIPALVAVRPDYAAAWEAFTGGLAQNLSPEPRALLDWCRATLPARA
ncbi:DUF2478 domain-containing protein [Rhodovulum steppense]|uniref:Uncharacterized protein DUF2478 n=1 Tax=Rhodovulum steppense TaxID=540251 RepID=A0A4R1Z095_9RHOB|nr:DUF2478 domain-containing protein [Rhodovulum steppense]TCM86980.1 uncharacterized protein DUF2478 [Rhodovulum steppense]